METSSDMPCSPQHPALVCRDRSEHNGCPLQVGHRLWLLLECADLNHVSKIPQRNPSEPHSTTQSDTAYVLKSRMSKQGNPSEPQEKGSTTIGVLRKQNTPHTAFRGTREVFAKGPRGVTVPEVDTEVPNANQNTVYVNIMERKYYGTGPFLPGPFHNIYVPKYLQGQLGTRR